jgi:hypothetical protein
VQQLVEEGHGLGGGAGAGEHAALDRGVGGLVAAAAVGGLMLPVAAAGAAGYAATRSDGVGDAAGVEHTVRGAPEGALLFQTITPE